MGVSPEGVVGVSIGVMGVVACVMFSVVSGGSVGLVSGVVVVDGDTSTVSFSCCELSASSVSNGSV